MAKRKLKIGGFKSKIWNACGTDSLRPAMQCAYIKGGYIYATDAHIAIKQCLENVHGIEVEQIKCLEGKLIHSKTLKLLAKCEIVTFKEDYIDVILDGIIMKINYTEKDWAFPDVDAIISKFESGEVPAIWFAPRLLNLLTSAMIGCDYGIKLSFQGSNKMMVVTTKDFSENDQKGIIMPVMSDY